MKQIPRESTGLLTFHFLVPNDSLKYNIKIYESLFIVVFMLRLVHSQDGEICVSGHSVVNDDEARSWYSYSVWDMNEKTCIQRITLEESQADFSGESE